ncbi:MAG: type II toxin-antitoxin system VapC family toxin [Bryobacteraceae bacterium]
MKLLDANLLLYAYDPTSEHHRIARAWLEATLSGPDSVSMSWIAILAFLRISTNRHALRMPLAEAAARVREWLSVPNVSILHPGERFWGILEKLLRDGQCHGNLIMDAQLAALAIEHGATLCTNDRDFTRFAGLKYLNPLN